MSELTAFLLTASRFVLIGLSLVILVRCIRSLLHESYEAETWAYLRVGRDTLPIIHWENLLGRSRSADIRLDLPKMNRIQAVLTRNDRGNWILYDVFGQGGVWANGLPVGANGVLLQDGDVLNLAGHTLRFQDLPQEKRQKLEAKRQIPGRVSPALTLFELTVFQLFLLMQHAFSARAEYLPMIAFAFAALIVLQWSIFNAMRVIGRMGFEVEILALYLTTLGLSVAATSTPEDMLKQLILTVAAVALFLLSGWWLRNLRRTALMRLPIAACALLLLGVNVVASDERLYRRRNLFSFIAFSAVCVVALALIGDFGTALVFFVTFLVLSFLRSGSIATVFLALTGAGLAGFLAVTIKPYIARRFATWGHVWEDMYDTGYQQTRALSAAASGGLFGKGAGAGWLKDVFAANTDMVFAMICEELGLIIAICMVLAILVLALFAVRSARQGRSSYYAIAACATMSMLLTQLALNVFGSLDLLPFTGVTFPFVSRGGSSLLSCWMLMAFLKGADNRRDASFAVRPGGRMKDRPPRAVYHPEAVKEART